MDNNMNNNPNNMNQPQNPQPQNTQPQPGQPQPTYTPQPSTVYNYNNPTANPEKKKFPVWAIILIAVGGVVIIGIIIVVIVLALVFGTVANQVSIDEPSTQEITESIADKKNSTEAVSTEASTEAPTETPTEAPTEVPVASGELAATLDSLQIQLDGVVYTLPYDYSAISSTYYFDIADYGYENGYVMNPGDSVSTTIELENESMDSHCNFWIGLTNTDAEAQDITLCDISGMYINIAFCDTGSYPSIVCPGGITWGSTYDDIVAAYGECEDPYYAEELCYYSLDYKVETESYTAYWTFETYDDGGLKSIKVRCY